MIFIRYESLRQYLRLYPVNSAIIAANLVMFIIMLFNGDPTRSDTLVKYGALTNVPGYDQNWRFVTSLFLHAGLAHLAMNMFAIFVFAAPLERLFGHAKYAFFYLIAGVLGNVFAAALSKPEWIAVGASTSIYALYGAYLFIVIFQRYALDQGSRSTILGILVVGLVMSFIIPGIGYWAHVGGLLAGFILYGLMGSRFLNR
ncbi:rhomboid family intramembrane serine protease [Cohnella ginsengisoli]|uniref:Rhomboid family intramembrane serine protease n=1 Tax=Cohnella ginsengisoli TaxID=425004 RepID=A0A9X4KDR4_9BACL|nr:rhomboid family intramembrane serine protease [Cohnella ginsengisoli]MDG0790122.1 rhomboid family intramembrane serine protease [Cohnella ginsengisoli]